MKITASMISGGMTRTASARKLGSTVSIRKLRAGFGSGTTAAAGADDGVEIGVVVLTSGMFMKGLDCVWARGRSLRGGPANLRLRYA